MIALLRHLIGWIIVLWHAEAVLIHMTQAALNFFAIVYFQIPKCSLRIVLRDNFSRLLVARNALVHEWSSSRFSRQTPETIGNGLVGSEWALEAGQKSRPLRLIISL